MEQEERNNTEFVQSRGEALAGRPNVIERVLEAVPLRTDAISVAARHKTDWLGLLCLAPQVFRPVAGLRVALLSLNASPGHKRSRSRENHCRVALSQYGA